MKSSMENSLCLRNLTSITKSWSETYTYYLKTGAIKHNSAEPSSRPGLIFADDDDVVPDVARLSQQRLAIALGDDGKLHSAPT